MGKYILEGSSELVHRCGWLIAWYRRLSRWVWCLGRGDGETPRALTPQQKPSCLQRRKESEESPKAGSCLLYSCIHMGWHSWPRETQEQGMFCS